MIFNKKKGKRQLIVALLVVIAVSMFIHNMDKLTINT